MTPKYSVKDWHTFQHFKDRKPPWIKLYRNILDDREWHELDPVAAKHLVMFWLLASENDGELPSVSDMAFRLRVPENSIKTSLSRLSHWLIQDDITATSPRHQDDGLERETETYRKEIEKKDITKKTKPRRTRLAEDWKLSAEEESIGLGEGLTKSEIAADLIEWREYWQSDEPRDPLKVDWSRTYRKHIKQFAAGIIARRNAGERPGKNNGVRQSLTTARSSVLAEIELFENGGADRVHLDRGARGESDRSGEADSQIVVEGDFTPRGG